jgi:copper chaperone
VELKVGMHCERCIKAIKKAIKTIDGELITVLAYGQVSSFYIYTTEINHPLYMLPATNHADMESYRLETEINKVTVTGSVTPEEVVKALHKIGKTATCWTQD